MQMVGKSPSSYQIITNDYETNPGSIGNCLILLIKFYIYRTKCLKQRLPATSCKNYIIYIKGIEEQIAKEKRKLSLHENKWSEIKT